MIGLAGSALCVACGAACGLALRERRRARHALLLAEIDALGAMRLTLSQERLGMGEVLARCAGAIPSGGSAERLARRLRMTAERLARDPLAGVAGAYRAAREALPVAWERAPEREAVDALFATLGSGTAQMREQAVTSCLKRLRPLEEQARAQCARDGALCVRLGALLGLMAGVLMW